MNPLSRRSFIRNSSLATASLGLVPQFLNASEVAPSESVTVALIGANGMGSSDLETMLEVPGVKCAAICDVDQRVLETKARLAEMNTGVRPDIYTDFRKVLDRKDIDAVIIGTPDHWHCLMMAMACEAGKDVYCEKPVANSIEEAELMVKIAERTGRVVQVGQWQRSDQHWFDAVQYVQNGALGRIRVVHAFAYIGWINALTPVADSAPPDHVDYDMWLGPAPKRPFNKYRFHSDFRWFWDYAGGLMTDWGVHLLDFALFGMDQYVPKSVVAAGGKMAYPDDMAETPDTLSTVYEFDGWNLVWEQMAGIYDGPLGNYHGVHFTGENGRLHVNRDGWQVYPGHDGLPWQGEPVPKMEAVPWQANSGNGLLNHVTNFVDCIKTREKPTADIEIGAHIAKVAHLGNIAYRTGRKIYWDPEKMELTGDPEATALTRANYRSPWSLPQA